MPRKSHLPTLAALNGVLFAAVLSALAACDGPSASPHDAVALALTLSTAPGESMAGDLFSTPAPTLYERLEQLRTASEDPRVRGLFVQVGAFDGGYAQAEELAHAFNRFRQSGKPLHCHFTGTDNAGYALMASACDRISTPPSGLLDLVGVRAQAFYARDFLENIGINAEMLQVGRFKGAADIFTENTMPDTTRLAMSQIVEALQQRLFETVAKGRKLTIAAVAAAAAKGPLTAKVALDRGLVDDVEYVDEARQHLRQAADVEHLQSDADEGNHISLASVMGEMLHGEETPPDEPHIALVPLVGTITGSSRSPMDSAAGDSFVSALKRLRDDNSVAAVVLRIDSPGGSAVASDLMWQAVYELKKRKPVIASVGNMAASGGYYVASAATQILVAPTSLVGSVGVVGGKIAAGDLADKLGIQGVTLRGSPNAGWSDPTAPFTVSQRRAVQTLLESTYELFLDRVIRGRGTSRKQLKAMADGRLWSATAAHDGGLVDSMGGLVDALQAARKAAKLPTDSQVHVWPPRHSVLDTLLSLGSTHTSPLLGGPLLDRALSAQRLLRNHPALLSIASGDAVAATMPFGLSIR